MKMENQTKRIFWMMDEVIGQTNPRDWSRTRALGNTLIKKIGNTNYRHEIADPVEGLITLAQKLSGQEFSCILDLTGWLTPSMKDLFPNTPTVDSFSLSRVRLVSSPKLETTGYVASMSLEDIQRGKNNLNLEKPLIVDDTAFSGWTARKTMELWGINPKKATHAFLMANTGSLGNQKGGVNVLKDLGSNVFYALEIHSPEDDSWHIKDLCQAEDLNRSIELSLFFKKKLDENGLDSNAVRDFFADPEVARALFPERLSSEQIANLIKEGKFLPKDEATLNDRDIHSRNPFLWASPYFQEHIDMNSLTINKDEVVSILSELNLLINDPEGKTEAGMEFRKEIRQVSKKFNMEGHFHRGSEKL